MDATEATLRLAAIDAKPRAYGTDKDEAIGFILRCERQVARNIVARIGRKLGRDGDAIELLQSADAMTLCECALAEVFESKGLTSVSMIEREGQP